MSETKVRPFRGNRLWQEQQSLGSAIKSQFRRFWDQCTSHDDILAWRHANVFDKESFQRLTLYYKAQVHQAFDVLVHELEDKLFWTHVLPNTPHRWLSRTDVDEPVYGPRIHDVVEGRGAHCYVLRIFKGDTVVFPRVIIPWQSDQLALDLEAGLVTQEMLDIVRNPHHDGKGYAVRRYWPGYWMNGRIYLGYESVEKPF